MAGFRAVWGGARAGGLRATATSDADATASNTSPERQVSDDLQGSSRDYSAVGLTQGLARALRVRCLIEFAARRPRCRPEPPDSVRRGCYGATRAILVRRARRTMRKRVTGSSQVGAS